MSIYDMFHSFLNPDEGYKGAEDIMRRFGQRAEDIQMPFAQHGADAYGQLSPALQALLHPEQLQAKWAQGYSMSPEAKQAIDQAKSSGLDAASSMGLMGSSAALGNIQQGASNIAMQDRERYMNDLMQKYMQGIGLGQNIYGTGASAAGNIGNERFNMGQHLSDLEFGRMNSPGDMLAKILGTGGALYLGGTFGKGNFGRGAWSA